MNPFKPIKHIIEAITFPLQALFVVGICFVVNWMTSPGVWWVQWVAFGMGIALLVKWGRAAKSILTTALFAAAVYAAYRWFRHRDDTPSAAAITPNKR